MEIARQQGEDGVARHYLYLADRFEKQAPDLVLLDITMPGISGLEVLEEIEKRDPGARVVMCSAVGQEQMIQKAVMLGARDFIVKPFRPDEFRRIIRNAMES